jgi:EAL domain-containing protein (putative c-di-GMP-specific phosphodiesterase class I)
MTEALRAIAGAGTRRVLELARRHLEMDLAFLAEFTDGQQVYRGLAGDGASFGWRLHAGLPLSQTYCRLMTEGDLPNAIPDTSAQPAVADLPVTADARIGSYVGVPVRLPDGSLYGSLCTVSHDAQPVDQRDAKFLAMLAELLAGEIQAERDQERARSRIRDLIDHRRVDIALQPIIDIATGRMLGVEALARFPSGYGPPDAVFAAAHAAGVGSDLERLAAERAYDVLPLLAPEQYLAINLTPAVAMELVGLEDLSRLPLDQLVLEITEHQAVENYALLRDSLTTARAGGLRLAIDDAGAGYASLHHIVELAPDIIKIDRSLVDGASSDAARRSVVRAFVHLAADLGASVIAEGVERPEDLHTVHDLGATAAQGYLLARPSHNRADIGTWRSGGTDLSRIASRPVG